MRRHARLGGIALALLAPLPLVGVLLGGCHDARHELAAREAVRVYPPQPQVPRAVALGTLRGAPPPSRTQVDLAMFFFGVEPPPPLTIANPTGLATRDGQLLICDSTLSTIFRWDAAAREISEASIRPSPQYPFAIDIAPDGDRLICDRNGVVRTDPTGMVTVSYRLDSTPFRPAGVLEVNDEVWVSNLAAHRLEVFDAASGDHRRSLGGPGDGPGRFAMPRGLARTPDSNVCVVDMLNNRVQVLDAQGNWVRTVGGPGVGPGTFGRPKHVAVGPDGTIFVTDAFSQRVHAFDAAGEPLIAFGEPGSGVGELTLPCGIAISTTAPRTQVEPPGDPSAAYYVLVAEQLNEPGVRVYAWLADYEPEQGEVLAPREVVRVVAAEDGAVGPHWDAESCETCHEEQEDDRFLPVPIEDSADVCLGCHEGHEEGAWVHPIDAEVSGDDPRVPAGWPLNDGQLACITCHDIKQQCDTEARRSTATLRMLRPFEPVKARSFCAACHVDTDTLSSHPHRQLDGDGEANEDSCLLCHEDAPEVPEDGARASEAELRDEHGSCLICHRPHWDYFSPGHFGRPLTAKIRETMRERLPLGDDRVACYTCHNPHQAGLFPAGSALAARASSARDAAFYLRIDRPMLCLTCHDK